MSFVPLFMLFLSVGLDCVFGEISDRSRSHFLPKAKIGPFAATAPERDLWERPSPRSAPLELRKRLHTLPGKETSTSH